jgi:hypothetical protein
MPRAAFVVVTSARAGKTGDNHRQRRNRRADRHITLQSVDTGDPAQPLTGGGGAKGGRLAVSGGRFSGVFGCEGTPAPPIHGQKRPGYRGGGERRPLSFQARPGPADGRSGSSSPTRRGSSGPACLILLWLALVGGRPRAVLAWRAPRPPTRGLAPPQAPVGARAPRPARAPLPEDPPARAAAGQAAALGPPSPARSWRARPFPYRMPCPRATRSVLRVRARTSTRRQLRPVLDVRVDGRELPHDVCLPVGELPAGAVKKRLIPSGGTLRRLGSRRFGTGSCRSPSSWC